jgi:O-antigen/teichoic acid export membrane protein
VTPKPSLGRVATRGASVTLSAQLVRFGLQIASLAILSRLLTPAQVGLVAMVTAILNVAEIIRDFGLSSAAIQSPTLSRDERSNLWWVNVAIGTACSLVSLALAPVIAALYGEPALTLIVFALAPLFIVSGANTQYRADLSRDLRFVALATTDITAQALSLTVAVACAYNGAGYWAIVAQQVTLGVASLLINAVQCRWLPGRPRRDVPIGRFVRFGAHLLGINLMGYGVNNVDNIAIGATWGAGPLGLYGRAYQLLVVPLQQVNAPLGRVVLPVLSRIQHEPATYLRFFARFQLAICYTLGLGFALLAGVSGPVVRVLLGPSWAAAAPILGVLAIGGIFKGIDSANYQLWVSKGLTGHLLRYYLVTRPVMVILILAGLPWGPIGVAVGHLVAAIGNWAIGLRYACRQARLDSTPLFAQSLLCLTVVIGPAGLLAWAATLTTSSALGGLVLGITSGLGYAALATVAVPALRRGTAPLVHSIRTLRGD